MRQHPPFSRLACMAEKGRVWLATAHARGTFQAGPLIVPIGLPSYQSVVQLQGGSGWLPMARHCTGPAAKTQRMKPSSSFFAHAMISLFDCPECTLANIVGWIARAYICAAMSGGAGYAVIFSCASCHGLIG